MLNTNNEKIDFIKFNNCYLSYAFRTQNNNKSNRNLKLTIFFISILNSNLGKRVAS